MSSFKTDVALWVVILIIVIFSAEYYSSISNGSSGITEDVKRKFEVAAYFTASVFLVFKIVSGQWNSGMETSLELKRVASAADPLKDNLYVLVKMKRNDVGRIMLEDIVLDLKYLNPAHLTPPRVRNPEVMKDRKICCNEAKTDQVYGISMPPGDGTHIAFSTQILHDEPVLVDATIVGHRTGQFWALPQWRVSAISFPEPGNAAPLA